MSFPSCASGGSGVKAIEHCVPCHSTGNQILVLASMHSWQEEPQAPVCVARKGSGRPPPSGWPGSFEARHAGSPPRAGRGLGGTGQLRAEDFPRACKGGLVVGQPGCQGHDRGAPGKLRSCLRRSREAGQGCGKDPGHTEIHRGTVSCHDPASRAQPGKDLEEAWLEVGGQTARGQSGQGTGTMELLG